MPDESNDSKVISRAAIFSRAAEFKENFSKESDRACVVLVAARLDELLHQALAHHLLPAPNKDDNLLDSDRALGTFSARIDIAYRLGLIDAEFCRALHILRRIRNEFAHESSNSSLEKSPHRERVLQLGAPMTHLDEFHKVRQKSFSKESHIRGLFSICSWMMVIRLERVIDDCRRIGGKPTNLIPPSWLNKPAATEAASSASNISK